MKKNAILSVIISSLSVLLWGCGSSPAPSREAESAVRVYDIPAGVQRYERGEVRIGGEAVPVYSVQVNQSQQWSGSNYSRVESGVCMFELDGIAEITVKPTTTIDYSSIVRPLSSRITPIANLEDNTLKITIKSAGAYVLEINGNPLDVIHFFVSDYDEQGVDAYTAYTNIEVFEAGLHTAENDSRIQAANNNLIKIESNTLVYLADGAVVRGRFQADKAENIAIAGRGVIDGSAFVRDATKNAVTVPIELNYCKDVLLKDFSILDPAGWSISTYFNEDVKIDSLKIISSRSNGDGISVQSCKNVDVSGCFVRTWDDSLVVKNYPRWENRQVHGETENVVFRDCVLWTDLAQSMELGYETVGTKFTGVKFDNITVLHAMHLAVMSIHNANNAEIGNVEFTNITIEDGKNAAANVGLIDFRVLYSTNWSDQHTSATPLGNIDGVKVENVKVLDAKRFSIKVGGCKDLRVGFESEHYVSNVAIKNISLGGKSLQASDCDVSAQNYVRNLSIESSGAEVTGATFKFSQTDEQLAKYGNVCKVQIIV